MIETGLYGLSKERSEMIMHFSDHHSEGNHDEITAAKQMILDDLYKDSDLFVVLNNPDLEGHPPEDYRNVNIFSYMKIPDTQSNVKNFLCFEVNDREALDRNNVKIVRQIVFRTVSHEDDVDTPWGVDRQDLLGLIIKDRFAWSNLFGKQIKKTYDTGKIAENGYYYRDIYFETTVLNGLHRATPSNNLDKQASKTGSERDKYDSRRFD